MTGNEGGIMKGRISLSGIVGTEPVTNSRGIQQRLYNNVLWGCYNNQGIKISKLKLNLQGLFPFDNGRWSLEYTKVETYVLSRNTTAFDLNLEVIQYRSHTKMVYVFHRWWLNIPLMVLPTLSKDGTVHVDGIEKTLITQLARDDSVVFDQQNGVINLTTKSLKHLIIHGSRIKHGDCNSDLFSTMLVLKSKYSHLLKNILELKQLVFYKTKWRYLRWNKTSSDMNGCVYGRRRLLRQTKEIVGCCRKNKVVCAAVVTNQFWHVIINMGDELDLNTNPVVKHVSVLRVVEVLTPLDLELLRNISKLIGLNLCYRSDIGPENIRDVSLSLIGRCSLNDITCCNQNFGLDLLTKKDLILVWAKHVIKHTNLGPINCDIRTTRGCGDYLIDVVNNHLASVLNSWDESQSLEELNEEFTIDNDNMVINSLLTSNKHIQKRIDKYFNSSSFCQYLDQVNSLSELCHKHKLTCISEGGLTSQNVDNYVRDTKIWHLGKICPIDSPEGQNVGLILSLSNGANVDVNGCIITKYFKVYNGLVSNNVVYLNYYDCKNLKVAISHWNDSKTWILCLYRNVTVVIEKKFVDLTLTTEAQVFSPAVCLIPFLEHNDPTRVLMAANMLKQAIPLLKPQVPLIGTGEELTIMQNTRGNVTTRNDGMVISADSSKVVVYESDQCKHRVYLLPIINKSNQEMCQRVRTVVNPGQMLRSGDVIAECQSSCDGQMSLGANLLVAFMCWKGYNFEDSVILSENVVNKGIFNSLHITDLETTVMKTKHGDEWLSADITEIPMKYRRCLDSNGVVKEGSNVREGDVLVGKLVLREDIHDEKGVLLKVGMGVGRHKSHNIGGNKTDVEVESDQTDDLDDSDKATVGSGNEKFDGNGLIKNIEDDNMGYNIDGVDGGDDEDESGGQTSNVSLRVPNGIEHATVMEVERVKPNEERDGYDGAYEEYLFRFNVATKKYIKRCSVLSWKNMIGCFSVKSSFISENKHIQKALDLLFRHHLGYIHKIGNELLKKITKRLSSSDPNDGSKVLEVIKIKLLVKKSIKVGDKICGRHGNKGVISTIVPKEDMPFMADGTPIDIILNPLGVPSRMNLGQILETNFGLISYKLGLEFKHVLNMYNKTNSDHVLGTVMPKLTEIYPNIKHLTKETILMLLNELSNGVRISCSLFGSSVNQDINMFNKRLFTHGLNINEHNGQLQLYDGVTGLALRNKTTVGIIYMFKLNHLVDDKIHARSTGPYSIVVQQPLKGKSHKGGQRLGEMEVWALQSYGAAHLLRESITARCDDMLARNEIRQNILHGSLRYKAYQNEGIFVLIKELFAMCIDIKLIVQ
ncbi:DNA-directed RNA polymerase subunit beta [Candidatus Hodgkinia cicadicola]|uniref:DNA-directed RNA polymerase subunit beta n=1 Tax=Candidatus Hodgkinia cicadicola TaxID=573658 RepID=A0ABX4MII5_9HYPH|nr:DNA-directed RNA polymerase subunit beta [Candidatus Hodgkinia cicadicola]